MIITCSNCNIVLESANLQSRETRALYGRLYPALSLLMLFNIIQALLVTFEHKRSTPLIRFDQTGVDKLKAWGE